MSAKCSPLEKLPPPVIVHQRIGQLYRELALLRRLLRLSQAVHVDRHKATNQHAQAEEAARA
jgi:hypothetical protein